MKCDRCFSSTKPPAPMFQNATWQKLAKKHETLCAKCAFARARKRGIELTFTDLLPCASNLEGPWFNRFLGAQPAEKQVSNKLAYAWQYAMITKSKQMRGGPAAQESCKRGTVLAADQNGLTLREAPEGGIYLPDEIDPTRGEKYLKVCQSDGDLVVAEIFVRFESDSDARIKEVIALRGPGSLGTKEIRTICRLLQQAYPSIETVSGFRMTGARLSKPEELKFNLRRFAGITTIPRREAA